MGYSPWGRKELDTAERLTLTLADPACLFVVCFLVSSSSLEKPCGSVQSVCMIQGWWEHSRGFGGHLRTIEIVLGSEGVSPGLSKHL